MIEQLGGRKFVGFLFVCLLLTIIVLAGKIDASEFVSFITANFGFFVAGNAISHLNDK